MNKRNLPFYATASDLSEIFKRVSLKHPLQLAVAGMFDNPRVELIEQLENPSPFTTYIVVDLGCTIALRVVPQRGGGERYAVDQIKNPDAILFQFGGLSEGERLVASQLGISGPGDKSAELSALLSDEMRARFNKIKSYYVGPEATELLDRGFRLAPTNRSPSEYDLVR